MQSRQVENEVTATAMKKLKDQLHIEDDGELVIIRKKACCLCDTLLDHRNSSAISLKKLVSKAWLQKSKLPLDMVKFFKDEYTIPEERCSMLSPSQRELLSRHPLSPRTVITVENRTPMLSICKPCRSSHQKPHNCIIQIPIGSEPDIIASLNEAELGLVSFGTITGHVFHIYAGSHKSIKTWHQIPINNVAHTVGNLNCLTEAGVPPSMHCFLSGSFTSHQKFLVKESIAINRDKVIQASIHASIYVFIFWQTDGACFRFITTRDPTTPRMNNHHES